MTDGTPFRLYMVVVSEISNALLMKMDPRWKVGTPVRRATSGFTGAATFDVGSPLDVYTFLDEANAAIRERCPGFAGVTFEVVSFEKTTLLVTSSRRGRR